MTDTELKEAYLIYRREQSRLRRQRKRERGECQECASPVVPGFARCEKHLRMSTRHTLKRYYKKKEQGLCGFCSEPAAPGKVLCERHHRENRERTRAWYFNKKEQENSCP